MRVFTDEIAVQGKPGAVLQTLIVEAAADPAAAPVLLYLHGAGEASPYVNLLPHVCDHQSPPFQALLGRLRGATVVAPQAPNDPKLDWNWRSYTAELGNYLALRFPGRKILAIGFSRGGLGVLQVAAKHPGLISRWAIVDPQRAGDDAEEKSILPAGPVADGWLRFGGLPHSKEFAEHLAARLQPDNTQLVDMAHGSMALGAFSGNPLGGQQNAYDYLGLEFVPQE